MHTAQYWIEALSLIIHPEGGFYREVYRSDDIVIFPEQYQEQVVENNSFSKRYQEERRACTLIYYLLNNKDRSSFHRLASDEIWHFYEGDPITIHEILADGTYRETTLGDPKNTLHYYVVRGNTWFASEVKKPGGYALTGCSVAPGFEFADFEMASKEEMIKSFPKNKSIIERLMSKGSNG